MIIISWEHLHMIGAAIHITITSPPRMFMAAQNGVIKGEPMYAICAQSKVTGNNPRPDEIPNKLATTTLFGANQVITLK